MNLSDLEEKLLEVHWRLKRVTIEHLDAVECIERYDRPGTFFYIDPPYWGTAGYGTPFGKRDFLRLEETLRKLKGKFILSLNDTPEVRETFKGFKFRTVTTRYSLTNGREKISRGKEISEVLIGNFPRAKAH